MILSKEARERIRLLEYENEILAYKLQEIEKQLKPIKPMAPHPQHIREGFAPNTYTELRKKYRDHKVTFNDGL